LGVELSRLAIESRLGPEQGAYAALHRLARVK
jgi:hypothetical protein